jgi:hypothetical protein
METDEGVPESSPMSGELDATPAGEEAGKGVCCYWKGKAYSPGAEIKDGNVTYICNSDGSWGKVETP